MVTQFASSLKSRMSAWFAFARVAAKSEPICIGLPCIEPEPSSAIKVLPSKRGTFASDLSTASLRAANTELALGKLVPCNASTAVRKRNGNTKDFRINLFIRQLSNHFVRQLRHQLQDIAKISQQREVAQFTVFDQLLPGLLFQLDRRFLRFSRRSSLRQLGLPGFCRSLRSVD